MNPAPANRIDRRSFLYAGGAALAAAVGPRTRAEGEAAPADRAQSVLFLVADGMSFGSLTLADLYCRSVHGRPLHWLTLMARRDARRALCSTEPATGPVTDSAAAASAWGIGLRVENGAICTTPDGREPTPLFLDAKRRLDKAVALVSTTRVTDATPACFVANAPKREMEREIAGQYLGRQVDVVLGGGLQFFPDDTAARRPDMDVVRTRAELLATRTASDRGLLGLFAAQKMAFEIDRPEHEPTLAEMTSVALARLEGRARGFVALIEGGRVDHAAHNNDAAALIRDLWAFDEAVGVAFEHVARRPDTLLIVTTDHANANPGQAFTGGAGDRGMKLAFTATRSLEWALERFAALPRAERTGSAMSELARQASGVTLTKAEIDVLDAWIAGRAPDPYGRANVKLSPLGSVLANHLGVAFVGPDHTSDQVECTAIGPGSEALPPVAHLTDVHRVVADALGLERST